MNVHRDGVAKELPIESAVHPTSDPTIDVFPVPSPESLVPGRDLALAIADVMSESPASSTLVLDVHLVSPLTDFFVICSGENERQLRAIQRQVSEAMAQAGHRPRRTEGTADGGWILIDFGDVVVHIFHGDQRAYYRLEDLWSEAQTLLSIQ